MTFDLPTLIAIRRRLRTFRTRPNLFHEVWTTARRRTRIERINDWFGPIGLHSTNQHLSRPDRDIPRDGRRYGRHFQ